MYHVFDPPEFVNFTCIDAQGCPNHIFMIITGGGNQMLTVLKNYRRLTESAVRITHFMT